MTTVRKKPGVGRRTVEETAALVNSWLSPVGDGHMHCHGPSLVSSPWSPRTASSLPVRRFLWLLEHGPDDLHRRKDAGEPHWVRAGCGDPDCYAIDHLEVFSVRDVNPPRDTCDRGHPFSEENTIYLSGYKRCRICMRAYADKRFGKEAP